MKQQAMMSESKPEMAPQRTFATIREEVAVTHSAVQSALSSVQTLMSRLGIVSGFGKACESGPCASLSGEIDETLAELRLLQGDARDLRGLVETLEDRL